MIEKIRAFNRYIKNNTLHRDYHNEQSRLQRIVIDHTEYYRDIQVIDIERSKELIGEVAIFIDEGYHISECLKYHNYILELYQLASKMDDNKYTRSVEILLLCVDTYKAYIQIDQRNIEIQNRLDLLKTPISNYHYEKVVKDYQKAVSKTQFERQMRYSNITPYNYTELSKIKLETGIKTKTNMLFDETFIADDIMEVIEMLGSDTREFNRLLQELIIVDNEITSEIEQIVKHTLSVVDIQKVSPQSLEIITITQDVFNDIQKKNPEYVLRLAYVKRLVYDTAFIMDSNTILNDSRKANKDVADLIKNLTSSIDVLTDFKRQKDAVLENIVNDQNPYILDYPKTIKAGYKYKESEALTLNQQRAINRDRVKKISESIDSSILEWTKTNPYKLDTINQERLKNTPLSYKYIGDSYRNTSSEFDELFQDKIFSRIVATVGLFNTNLAMVQGVIDTVIGLIQGLIDVATAVIQGVLNTLLTALQAIKCLLKAIACAVASLLSTVKDVLGKVLPILKKLGGAGGLTESMKNLPGAIYGAIKDAVTGIVNEAIGEALKELNKMYDNISDAMGADVADVFMGKVPIATVICKNKMTNNLMNKLLDFAKATFDDVIGSNINLAQNGSSECPSLLGNLNMGIGLGSLRMKRLRMPGLNGRIGGC